MFELGYLVIFAGYCLSLVAALVLFFYLASIIMHGGEAATAMRLSLLTILILFSLFLPMRLVWNTRYAAVPGSYRGDGVWGTVTLNLKPNGSFEETWHKLDQYSGLPEGDGHTSGTWNDHGRDWATRNLTVSHFKFVTQEPLATVPGDCNFQVRGYGGLTSIELGPGSDFVLYKQD